MPVAAALRSSRTSYDDSVTGLKNARDRDAFACREGVTTLSQRQPPSKSPAYPV
jgi:hypothetical protein